MLWNMDGKWNNNNWGQICVLYWMDVERNAVICMPLSQIQCSSFTTKYSEYSGIITHINPESFINWLFPEPINEDICDNAAMWSLTQ